MPDTTDTAPPAGEPIPTPDIAGDHGDGCPCGDLRAGNGIRVSGQGEPADPVRLHLRTVTR
jgi:hypothetical protein